MGHQTCSVMASPVVVMEAGIVAIVGDFKYFHLTGQTVPIKQVDTSVHLSVMPLYIKRI